MVLFPKDRLAGFLNFSWNRSVISQTQKLYRLLQKIDDKRAVSYLEALTADASIRAHAHEILGQAHGLDEKGFIQFFERHFDSLSLSELELSVFDWNGSTTDAECCA